MGLISVGQYEDRANTALDAGEQRQVSALIDDASAEVLLVGDDTWTVSTVPAVVVGVVYQMVRRAVQNPEGFQSETIGDYSYSRASTGDETSAMTMTRDEYRRVRRAAGKSNVLGVGVRRGLPYERDWLRGAL